MIKFEFEGREFEFRGEYRVPEVDEYFLSATNIEEFIS